jgi:uncharacterized protein (TIGR03083 family)
MPTIVDKERAVQLLRDEFAATADLGATFDETAWNTPTCLPGWTVKDSLSHMVGTESSLAGEPMPKIDLPDLPYLHNDIAKLNEQWVASMRRVPGAAVLERFRSITRLRLAALDAMTQADFDAPSWTPAGPDETYGRFMRIRHYDCFLHEHDMRAALGVADRTDVEPVRFSLEEVLPALGYAVGRKAAMPKGSRVRIHVTGALDEEILVAVDDRAAVVSALDGAPTVGITLPVMLFFRLTGGRTDAASHTDEITVEGDAALAMQLASNLAFTI